MKFSYAYKSSDGVRHEALIDAGSREDAFAELRKQGIRPIKVVAQDGSRANGAPARPRKRWIALAALASALAAGAITWFLAPDSDVISGGDKNLIEKVALSLPRQMINGNRDRIEQLPDGFFANNAEAFLAHFAEPGRPFKIEPSDVLTIDTAKTAMTNVIRYSESEFTERIDLKRIVVGLKHEMGNYIRGGGSIEDYVQALINRQQTEIAYRSEANSTLEKLLKDAKSNPVSAYDFWLKANAKLQSMGIYPIPLPESLRSYQMSLPFEE